MAESLFDNRYRYDYIYPRGRSGETLRAADTQANNQPVVIKRPAPNDAPPIRAGQEVSINNERRALQRLAGHPVLTELLGGGQFFVGGVPHQYIVMERATGMIVADKVLELAAQGNRLPELEMLVIVDHLLDLLHVAHAKDIVYNDVDAKHLFWDRETYSLKVIDWGNAVFLEGDEVTPQGISRQTDVYQVGELLYFILTGGGRADLPRDADDNFRMDFGQDRDRIHSRLQSIISRAIHPNTKHRYASIADLRRELAEYRAPLERDRDSIIRRVEERMQRELSKTELRSLLNTLEPTLEKDPGFPASRAAFRELIDRLRDLEVSADLDAVRIYMESGNWSRAADLLRELRDKAGSQTGPLINLLLDCTVILVDTPVNPVPPAVPGAIVLMFEGQVHDATATLLLNDSGDADERRLQWQIAERISSHIPEVLLLRPNLFRLDTALAQLEHDGIGVQESRAALQDIDTSLDTMARQQATHITSLRDDYRAIVDKLMALNPVLQTISVQYNLSNRRLPITTLDRATDAAMALADNMHVIGKQAAGSPRDALAALDSSRHIDPANPLWDGISRMLDSLYDLLQSYQTYIPAADGSDLGSWLADCQADLKPFMDRLFDEMLVGMVDGLAIAESAWAAYTEVVVQGNRVGALQALTNAIEAVGTISPTLAGWLNQLRNVVGGSRYIERHAVQGGLGRALADGWEAFDRGRLVESERLGQQAFEIARTDEGREAARRLRALSDMMREWVDRNGIQNASRTRITLNTVDELFNTEERRIHDDFAAQMPSNETYLRAMQKGLIELYERSSTAASRILFGYYVLQGTLDAHDGRMEDAEFWRDAAQKALGEFGARHIATRALDEFIQRRHDLDAAAVIINQVSGQHALATLESTRRQIEENPQARLLGPAIHSLRELEASVREWANGEFRAAGMKLDSAIKALGEAEKAGEITLTAYRSWLMDLNEHAAQLHVRNRDMHQLIEKRPDDPLPEIAETHGLLVNVTTRLLGEAYAATLRQWNDTYHLFLETYTDSSIRRSARLARFNELFRAMFIDRHPAYPLYRHWYDVTERSPEFPAPPTDEPMPRIAADDDIPDSAYLGSRYVDGETPQGRFTMRNLVLLLAALIAVVAIVLGIVMLTGNGGTGTGGIALTLPTEATVETVSQSATEPTQSDSIGAAVTSEPTITPLDTFDTPTVRPSPQPTIRATNTPSTPTDSPTPSDTPTATVTDTPTHTYTPTETDTPTATYTPSITPTPTVTPLPEGGVQGTQNMLDLFNRIDNHPWDAELFSAGTDGSFWRLGVGAVTAGDFIFIQISPDFLETYFGNNAAARVRRVEVTMTLTTHNPAALTDGEIDFGVLVQQPDDPGVRAGLRIRTISPQTDILNLGLITSSAEGDGFISQRRAPGAIARIRIERDLVNGQITAFVNDNPVGQPIDFIEPDAPIVPILFVTDGGVVMSVTNFRITFR